MRGLFDGLEFAFFGEYSNTLTTGSCSVLSSTFPSTINSGGMKKFFGTLNFTNQATNLHINTWRLITTFGGNSDQYSFITTHDGVVTVAFPASSFTINSSFIQLGNVELVIYNFNQSDDFWMASSQSSSSALASSREPILYTDNGDMKVAFRKAGNVLTLGSFTYNATSFILHSQLESDFDSDNIANSYDIDLDNDGILNNNDGCSYGKLFLSTVGNDRDQDGCRDSDEDLDDDGDGKNDTTDQCATGTMYWI